MTFLRQRETSRISSRGKGPVYNTGGGGGRSSPLRRIVPTCDRINNKSKTITKIPNKFQINNIQACNRLSADNNKCNLQLDFLTSRGLGTAACMIIEDRNHSLFIRPRQTNNIVRHYFQPSQDTDQSYLNHLCLLKHRTAKFSSNRHRKLQPFRET